MPHDHNHDHSSGDHHHAPKVRSENEKVVLAAFLVTFCFMLAELIGGLLSGSLALIADAGHMLTDAAALALAWAGSNPIFNIYKWSVALNKRALVRRLP